MPMTPARELQLHLDSLGIDSSLGPNGTVSIVEPGKLLAHLTDEEFIARGKALADVGELVPVPTHRTDNPVGALQEWCTKKKTVCTFTQSDNIGTVHAPRFACEVGCDGLTVMAEASSKAAAKRDAALGMLAKLSVRHGMERP